MHSKALATVLLIAAQALTAPAQGVYRLHALAEAGGADPGDRFLATNEGSSVLFAAWGESEAAQLLLVAPEKGWRGLTLSFDTFRHLETGEDSGDFLARAELARGPAEALRPWDDPLDLEGGTALQVWLQLHVPEDARPGRHRGMIRLSARGWSDSLALDLEVWPFELIGLPPVKFLDEGDALELDEYWLSGSTSPAVRVGPAPAGDLPGSVLIVGGGVIGCEFATLYAELGVRTHLVEALPGLLGNIDPDAARIVARSLRRRKVKVTTSAEIVAMSADEEGVSAELADGTHIGAEVALVAVGREPNVEDIGLESVGIELTDGIIPVDEHCRTAVEGVYAVGDVAERMQYAHLAARMGVVAADNATGHEHSDDRAVVPECIYTHPEVAAVGLRKVRLATAAGKVRTAMFPLQASGMARACGQTDGLVKLFGHAETGEVLGGVVVAPRATDMIAEIALAARCGLKVEDLAETIHAHPSFCESVRSAAESWLGLGIDTLE